MLSILFGSSWLFGQAQPLEEVRKIFHEAVKDQEISQSFHEYMKSLEASSATVMAYEAVSEAMLARVVWNPFSKLSQVRKYQQQMDLAVRKDPENIEIRFLRLAIEYNLPSFLGMSTHIEEDIEMIMNNLGRVSSMNLKPGYSRYIFDFIESTDLCSQDQLVAIRDSFPQATASF